MRYLPLVFGLSLAIFTVPALSAKKAGSSAWRTIASDQNARLELDTSRVSHTAKGEIQAWSRVNLTSDMPDSNGGAQYSSIEALNSYACGSKRFTTLKRVYLRHGSIVREERVSAPHSIAAGNDSLDSKLLATVCKAQTFAHARRIAETPTSLAENTKPSPMYADMRTLASLDKPQLRAVADATDSKAKADSKEKPTASGKTPAPKRFIELPKVDKSQLEEAGKGKATEGKESKEGKGRMLSPNDRLVIEQQLATSGPHKVKPKKKRKPKAKPAVKAEAPVATPHHDVHWSYEGEGAPANWSKLSPANALCATGKRQSPIDIRDGIRVQLEPIKFDYQNAQFTVIDNGHTIQVNIGEGNTLTVMGRTYQLVQFHFHRPSEERINGRAYEMVAHFVHKDMEGRLAVVAVLFERGPQENPQIQTVWNNLPLEVGQTVSPTAVLDLTKLLPTNRDYWTYMGSLTTPPCSEDVLWMVLKQPIQVSGDQIAIFSRLYKNNTRPIQPANGRLIKESR